MAIAHNLNREELDKIKIESLGQYLFEGIEYLNDICLHDKGANPFDPYAYA